MLGIVRSRTGAIITCGCRCSSSVAKSRAAGSVSKIFSNDVVGVVTKFDPDAPLEESGVNASGKEAETISKRKAFRKIELDYKILAYLDSRNLGREKSKVASHRRRSLIEKGFMDPPNAAQLEDPSLKTFEVPKWAIKKVASVKTVADIPEPMSLPEVAFVGRSNVGKSTLLNAVLGIKGFPLIRASTSDKPGETRSIDFYRLGKGKKAELVLVDTPGFGFAFSNADEAAAFNSALLVYLRGRGNPLKRVCLLLDARHGIKRNDVLFLQRLYARKGTEGVPKHNPLGPYKPPKLQVIMTKCDLVQRMELVRRITQVRQHLNEATPRETRLPVLMVSALTDKAVDDIRKELAGMAPQRVSKADALESNVSDKNEVKDIEYERDEKEKVAQRRDAISPSTVGRYKTKETMEPRKPKGVINNTNAASVTSKSHAVKRERKESDTTVRREERRPMMSEEHVEVDDIEEEWSDDESDWEEEESSTIGGEQSSRRATRKHVTGTKRPALPKKKVAQWRRVAARKRPTVPRKPTADRSI